MSAVARTTTTSLQVIPCRKPPRKKTGKTAHDIVLVNHGRAITTTIAIADGVQVQHKNVIGLVKRYKADFVEFGPIAFQTRKGAPLPHGGFAKSTEFAELNEDQATYLMTLFRNTEIVREFKVRLVKAFRRAIVELERLRNQRTDPAWQAARLEGKAIRRELTDALQEFVDYAAAQGSKNARRYWETVTRMVSVAMFGSRTDRDSLTQEQIRLLGMAEIVTAKALRDGVAEAMPYKSIYPRAKSAVAQFADLLGTGEGRLPALAS